MAARYADLPVTHHEGKILVPGFIDTHIHYPQTEMIASYGLQLLDWLQRYTFPTEAKFAEKSYASQMAKTFLEELLRNGTTTAMIFSTVHKCSAEALFEEAEKLNMRIITGKVMMDREPFAPPFLRDTAESSYTDSKDLIAQWHNRGRLLYAVMPRFAITSSEEQLKMARQLMDEHPSVYMHTHLSENKDEVNLVKELFGDATYTETYHRFGLLGPKSVFAHSVHMSDPEWNLFKETDSCVSFCPASNFFLGSGLFDLKSCEDHGVRVGMGTDVGGGCTFSLLKVMCDAYKACQLQRQSLSAVKAFYLSTLGAASALSLDSKLGNFAVGKEADFLVLDTTPTVISKIRLNGSSTSAASIEDRLFAIMILGDERNVERAYIMGEEKHRI
eukprot:GILJ01005305.1.p1 GENE.GILJ01005305.1~~GILJ01005305.1.p1  ORF type:complete len:451 (+),score=77.44 GILJ01005305.1:192-1355(+)